MLTPLVPAADIPLLDWAMLAGGAFFAGLVDAAAGGGGLVQIPVLMGEFPEAALATLFGTNKLASIAGTASAAWRFARRLPVPWDVIGPTALAALLGAWLGANVVSWLPRDVMRPLALVLMAGVLGYTVAHKTLGHRALRPLQARDRTRGAFIGLLIGCYDGFFGPGTGSFLIFAFVRFLGMDFLQAAAGAKIVNAATNLAALAFFTSHVPILWTVAAVMALCNMAGAQVGAALALRRGQAFIRGAFLTVVTLLIARLAWDLRG